MNNRKEIKYNALVGRIDNDYYFLDYTFQHDDNFKGATGSIMSPLTEEDYNQRVEDYFDPVNFKEFWVQAVEQGNTEMGLEDYAEYVRSVDGDDFVFDLSYSDTYGNDVKDLLGDEKAFIVECVGGGRCFSKNMKFDEVYSQELIDIINQFEEEEEQSDD